MQWKHAVELLTIFIILYLTSSLHSFIHVHVLFQLLTYGRRIPFAELFARIDAVDASTIKRVANRFIYDKVMIETYLAVEIPIFFPWIVTMVVRYHCIVCFSAGCSYCCHGSYSAFA